MEVGVGVGQGVGVGLQILVQGEELIQVMEAKLHHLF